MPNVVRKDRINKESEENGEYSLKKRKGKTRNQKRMPNVVREEGKKNKA